MININFKENPVISRVFYLVLLLMSLQGAGRGVSRATNPLACGMLCRVDIHSSPLAKGFFTPLAVHPNAIEEAYR